MRKRNAQLEVLISLAVILALIGLWIALTPTINRIEQKEQAASEIEAFYEERAEAASRHDHNHGSYEAPVMPLSQENNDGTNGTVYSELLAAMQPWQAEELLIQEGRDLLTLCTCHPYGSGGKYRYIVYCERTE